MHASIVWNRVVWLHTAASDSSVEWMTYCQPLLASPQLINLHHLDFGVYRFLTEIGVGAAVSCLGPSMGIVDGLQSAIDVLLLVNCRCISVDA